jgi:hypothetical protein
VSQYEDYDEDYGEDEADFDKEDEEASRPVPPGGRGQLVISAGTGFLLLGAKEKQPLQGSGCTNTSKPSLDL